MSLWRRRPRESGGAKAFQAEFRRNLADCRWEPHPLYNVFTTIDADFYLDQREAFLHKYRCFYAVARTIAPSTMIELGVCAGAGADAYLSGCLQASYLGIDTFGEPFAEDDGSAWRELRLGERSLWKPHDIATALLADRGFDRARLIVGNLRHLETLPERADLVVVDAGHDFENQYADLRLALTAEPTFMFVDDVEGEEAALAVKRFLEQDLAGPPEYTVPIDYIGGGLVIKLR